MKKYTYILIILLFLFITNYTSYNFDSSSLDFIYPTKYTDISSDYGNRILYGQSNFHNGIDFLAPLGSEIYASASGIIEYASFLESGYGNTVIISHDFGIKTLYCHISETFVVKVGDYVHQGDIIGYVGPKYLSNGIMNGNTTGPHLHFTIFENEKTVDPSLYIKK
jgi:murein DD-endopeptidase MepM/ murein hydrolase activator NlpD